MKNAQINKVAKLFEREVPFLGPPSQRWGAFNDGNAKQWLPNRQGCGYKDPKGATTYDNIE